MTGDSEVDSEETKENTYEEKYERCDKDTLSAEQTALCGSQGLYKRRPCCLKLRLGKCSCK